LKRLASEMKQNGYGEYLLDIVNGRRPS